MKKTNFFSVLIVCSFLLMNTSSQSQNATGWRGNNRDDKVKGFNIPVKWPAQLQKSWQVKVGTGDASPLLSSGKLYLHVRVDSAENIVCLDAANGTVLWNTKLNSVPEIKGPPAGHPGPRGTPYLSNGKLYTLGVTGILTCIDSKTGKIIWQNSSYTNEVPQFFTGCSPFVYEGKCLVNLGGKNKGVVIAFDANTGKEAWKLEGEPCTYSSPVQMRTIENMLLVQAENELLGVSFDGKILWKIPTPNLRMFYSASTPVFDGKNIIVTGQGKGSKCYRLVKNGINWDTTLLWKNDTMGVSFCTPLLRNGFMYANDAKSGKIWCLDANTGKPGWISNVILNRFASISDLGNVLVSLPANGKLIVFEPNSSKYVELAQYKVAETDVYAHPLFLGNKIFVKDQEKLTCWSVE